MSNKFLETLCEGTDLKPVQSKEGIVKEESKFLSELAQYEPQKQSQSWWSKAWDDLTNIDDAWRAGNFYSKGGWNEISKNIINGGTSEDREKLYNAYKAWSTANPAPENKTWVGDVVNGVSNLIPLAIDMQPEALKVGGLTGGAGLAIGAATGPGAVATGSTGAVLGYKASMMEQSYKVGVADVYTSLRDDGIDDETAKDIALIAGVPYGALEYFGKALAPVQRRLLGGRKLIDAIDKITDKKIKNKVLNFIAKKGADVAITGTAETAVEGAQAGVVEGAAQSAKGEFDGKKIASAAWEEAKGAAPAMFGMAALGIPLDAAVSNVSKPKASTKETRHLDEMVKQGKDLISPQDLPEVASGVKPGETFKGNDGKTYRNYDGVAMPVQEEAAEKQDATPEADEDLLGEDAQGDPYAGKPDVAASPEQATKTSSIVDTLNNLGKESEKTVDAEKAEKARKLFFNNLEKDPYNVPAVETKLPLIELVQMRQQLAEKEAQRMATEEAKAREEEELNRLAEEDVAQQQFDAAKKRTAKKYKALSESQRAFNREKQELRKLLDSIPEEDEAARLDVIDNVDDVSLLDDKDLDFAMEYGREWAYDEMQKRQLEADEKQHDTLLDVMERRGYALPTPKAMRERGGSADLYGEIKDLHDNLYQAGGKGRHWLQKFFRDRYISVDDMVQALNADEGFSYNSTDEFISDFAENLAGHKTTRSNYSLADQQKKYDKNFNKKFKAIEKAANQFYKNAKHKAKVVVVNNRAALENELGRKLPPNANVDAMRDGDNVYLVADKLESPRKAVSKLFHEYVGHYGLQGLLGDDFKPFIAYIRNKYKGTKEFEALKEKYQEARNSTDEDAEYEAAEELISYLAEHGELSSASFMGRLLSRVKRALKKDGITDAYVNLLGEEDLRDAVIASRQWASGRLKSNSNLIGDAKDSTRAKDVPGEKAENFSLADDAAGTKKNVFGDRAKNGDFDLANIDLNDYEGMDTSDWDNETWEYSWDLNADIQYALNEPEDFPPHDWISAIAGEALPYGECKEISTRTLENIIASKELARLARADPEINISGILAGIIAQPTATKEVRKKAVKKIKALNLFENAARELLKSHWADQDIVNDFVRDNAKNISENNTLWFDYVDVFTGDIIPSDIADKIIKWAKDSGATGAYTLKVALKKNLFSDSDKLKCVKIAPLSVANLDNNDAATIAAINDELMRRDDRYVADASTHIYDDIINGNFDGNIALLKPILKRMASLDERFIEVTNKVISELAGLKDENDTGYKAWSGDFSKRRPPQDLRDVAYYNALDRNSKEDAKAIVAERMKESRYRESPKLMHTSRAQNIESFIFDDELARKNGENVKAYGHGAYMTESDGTTKYYRKQFSDANVDDLEIKTKSPWGQWRWRELTVPELRAVYIRQLCRSEKEAEKLIRSAKWGMDYVGNNTYAALVHTKGKKLRLNAGGVPRTYNIAWNLSPEETLNLDEPFSGQNPEVQKKLLKFDRALTKKLGKTDFHRALFKDSDTKGVPSNYYNMRGLIRALEQDLDSDAEASRVLTNFGIRGSKFANGQTRNKDGKKEYNYISFEGGSALKLRESITRDEEGRIVPPSERFDPNKTNWNFSLEEMDEPLTEREQKNIETFKRNIQNGSSRLDISQNKAYKESGLNCNRIIMRKSVMDKAEKLGIDTDKIPYELLRPTAIIPQNKLIKHTRILTNLTGKQDRIVCFQGAINKENFVVLEDILGYRKEKTNEILNDAQYINKEKVRLLRNHANYTGDQTDAIVQPNEPSFNGVASEYSRPSQAIYSENLEKAMDTADKAFEGKKDKVVNSLRNMGVEVTEDKRSDTKSQYIDVHLDNGSTIYVRVSNHPAKTRIDVSIEKDWKAGTRFIYDQVEKNDWGTKNNPYWQGDARLKFSLTDEETSEKEQKRLEREKEARAEITTPRARIVQATTDAFAPLAALERILYGKVRGAEKSAWKMALMTKNLDQVMFHILRVGGITYDKATGEMKHRKGSIALESILKRVRGKNYKNFEHYALAKSAIERWAKLRKQKFYADKDFAKVFGFTLEDARKWASEGTENTKKAFADLQKFFQANRDFMLETGLIGEKQHQALSEFKNYVPFFREGEDLDAETQEAFDRAAELNPGGRGMSARNSGIQKFIGSSRKTKNLIESIVNQTRHIYDAGYKNIAMYRSLNLMRQIGMATYLKQDTVDVKAKLAEMKRALEEAGVDVGALSDEEIMQKAPIEAFADLTAQDEKTNDNIVAVRVNGTLRFYKVEDKELLVAVKNFGGEKFNVLWKVLTTPKNIMTWAITKLPEFAVRNFIRDTGSNSILFGGKTIAPYLGKTFKNLGKSAFADEHMKKLWAAGAGGGSWYSVNAGDIASDFKDDAKGKAKKIGKYIVRPFTWLLDQYERRVLIPSEQANRLTRMEQSLARGESDMEAAFQAMDVLNFGMRGSGVWTGKSDAMKGTMKVLHAIVRITPFLNARIQGLYKLWRESGAQEGMHKQSGEFGAKNRTRAFIQGLSKAVLMRGMMLAGASVLYAIYANSSKDDDDEEWYKKLPAHDKLNYWHFYLGNNTIIRIPKPFEIGYLFGTIPEAMTDAMLQERPDTAKVLWEGLLNNLEFNPTSNPVLDTYREQISNEDSFTERPIVQQSDKSLSAKYQYDQDTSASAKAIANVFGAVGLDKTWLASPARIQNVIGNMLGGMTRYVTAASDVVVESLTDIEGGTSRYARESVFKAPYSWATRNTRTMNTRNAVDFYELREQVREIYGAARVLRQEKRMDELQTLIDEHKGELGNYDLVEAINTRLTEISRKRRALGANKTLSTEEIIRKDDELIVERNRILAMVDILIDRVDNDDFDAKDMKEILQRIKDADKDRKDSKKAGNLIKRLANMR